MNILNGAWIGQNRILPSGWGFGFLFWGRGGLKAFGLMDFPFHRIPEVLGSRLYMTVPSAHLGHGLRKVTGTDE
jgi:hypothetical protein